MKEQNESPARIISFLAEKGGVGKTTLSLVLANFLHDLHIRGEKGKKVVVIDADNQKLTWLTRQNELANNPDLDPSTLYPIVPIPAASVPDRIAEFASADYIILDLPGNAAQAGVKEAVTLVDHIFLPMGVSLFDVTSAGYYYSGFINKLVTEKKQQFGLDVTVNGVFSKISTTDSVFKELYEKGRRGMLIEGVKFLETAIPEQKAAFQKNVSTIIPFSTYKGSSLILNFCHEIMEIVEQ